MEVNKDIYQLNRKVVSLIGGEVISYDTLKESDDIVDILDNLHCILDYYKSNGYKILMSDCKIFEVQADGKSAFYSIDYKPIPKICKFNEE